MDIETQVKATEDPEKLKKAIKSLFPESNPQLDEEGNKLRARTNFDKLWDHLEKQKIRTAILEELEKNKTGKETYLDINKTPATAGKISTYVGSSIGKIRLKIPWKEAENKIKQFKNKVQEDKEPAPQG